MENGSSDINTCVLQVLNKANTSQNTQASSQDNFVRVHMHKEGFSVRFSNKKKFKRNSRKRRSTRRQKEHNLDNIKTMNEVNPCETSNGVENYVKQPASAKFDSGYFQYDKRIFGRNQHFNNKSNRGRRFGNRHWDERTANYDSSYNRRGEFRYNQQNQKDPNIPLRKDLVVQDANDENSGCFMKMLDCFCNCFCAIFK